MKTYSLLLLILGAIGFLGGGLILLIMSGMTDTSHRAASSVWLLRIGAALLLAFWLLALRAHLAGNYTLALRFAIGYGILLVLGLLNLRKLGIG
jgi:hypothetical protein